MTTRTGGMYVIQENETFWVAFVITTILPDPSDLLAYDEDREHGWFGEGATEADAISELQSLMVVA